MDNIPAKVTGGQWLATEVNTVAEELKNAVTQTGQTLGADNLQLTRSIAQAASGGQYFESVHAPGVYALSTNSTHPAIVKPPHQLTDGLVVRFIADADSTANDNLKLGSLVSGAITVPGGAANISAGDIKLGDYVECIYRLGTLTWELVSSIFRNEPDMASNSAVAVASQASIVSYVRDYVGALGHKNLLINPNFMVNQRVRVAPYTSTVSNDYVMDRWRIVTLSQSVSWADSNGVRTITVPAGGIEQVIAAENIIGGSHAISFESTVDTVCTITETGQAAVVRTSGQAFVLVGGQNVTIEFSSVSGTGTVALPQFERGTYASLFDIRLNELDLCLYYHENSYNIAAAPGTNVGSAAIYQTAYTGSDSFIAVHQVFHTKKRISPTVVMYSPSGAKNTYRYRYGAGVWTDAATSTNDIYASESGFSFIKLSGAVQVSMGIAYSYTADAEF